MLLHAPLLLFAPLLLHAPPVHARIPQKPFLAYHASWYEAEASSAEETTLARLPAFINIVALAFARPDLTYAGGLDLSGSGLEYRMTGAVLKEAIALLRERRPRTKVVISVGGAGWPGWNRFDEHALARLVRDLGADGVDLDYEPPAPDCLKIRGRMRCASDATWVDLIERVRAVLPRPYLLTVPGWSTGAYGEGAFAGARPASPWTGSMLHLLRSPAASQIDLVSIMAYDAGPLYDPAQAFAAYRAVWKGPLLTGVAVRGIPPGSGELRRWLEPPRNDAEGGAMLYALRDCVPEAACAPPADYRAAATALCRAVGHRGCGAAVP